MNDSEFFDILATLEYEWYLLGDKIRAEKDGKSYCPVNAVAKEVTTVYIDPTYPMACARYMDMDRRFAAKLVQAIDNTHLTPEIVLLRNRLLEICDVAVRATV